MTVLVAGVFVFSGALPAPAAAVRAGNSAIFSDYNRFMLICAIFIKEIRTEIWYRSNQEDGSGNHARETT